MAQIENEIKEDLMPCPLANTEIEVVLTRIVKEAVREEMMELHDDVQKLNHQVFGVQGDNGMKEKVENHSKALVKIENMIAQMRVIMVLVGAIWTAAVILVSSLIASGGKK
jgi:hypothetical protein